MGGGVLECCASDSTAQKGPRMRISGLPAGDCFNDASIIVPDSSSARFTLTLVHAVKAFDEFVVSQPPLARFTPYIGDSGIQISSSQRQSAVQLA
eukprot:1044237-Pyramimonas_sp.AAC.1